MKRFAKAGLVLALTAAGFAHAATELVIATVNNGHMIEMQKLTPFFEKANPDIKLKWVTLEEGTLRQRVTTDIATKGGQFDVMTIGLYETPIWSKKGWLKPIATDAAYDADDLLPAIRDGLSTDGKLYAAPFYGESSMLMYRKDLADKLGIKISDNPTWTEVRAFADKANDPKAGVYGMCLRGKPGWGDNMAFLSTLVNTNGGQWFDMKWKPQINSAPWKKAVTDYVELLTKKVAECTAKSSMRFAATGAIGVAPIVLGSVAPADVLRFAHGAAQDARTLETTVCFFSPTNDTAHRRRFELLQDFEAALTAQDQLRLVYQPRVDLARRQCLGAEVLLRWMHPVLGDVSPAEFIPLIEQTAHAKPLTQWVIDRALEQFAGWITEGFSGNLSINLSANNLEEPDFAARVQLLLFKHRIHADRIELEITESAIMRNVAHARDQLTALRAAGIRLAIDDFGTGYSSLAYLQQLPVDVVKIDQSFMRDLGSAISGGDERTLVRTMIRLSHELGYRVVAEGVETEAAVACLTAMHCDEAQGFLFARPMDATQFIAWYAGQNEPAQTPRAAA